MGKDYWCSLAKQRDGTKRCKSRLKKGNDQLLSSLNSQKTSVSYHTCPNLSVGSKNHTDCVRSIVIHELSDPNKDVADVLTRGLSRLKKILFPSRDEWLDGNLFTRQLIAEDKKSKKDARKKKEVKIKKDRKNSRVIKH